VTAAVAPSTRPVCLHHVVKFDYMQRILRLKVSQVCIISSFDLTRHNLAVARPSEAIAVMYTSLYVYIYSALYNLPCAQHYFPTQKCKCLGQPMPYRLHGCP